MSKVSELSMLLDQMITCGNTLTQTAQALKDFYSSEETVASAEKPKKKESPKAALEPAAEAAPEKPAAKKYTKEEVRALLAKKANEANGQYKAQVKAIVKKYGNGGSLTNVKPADYAALVAEMETISNAG